MKYILAHDLGTSGNKATLFSGEGKLITQRKVLTDLDGEEITFEEYFTGGFGTTEYQADMTDLTLGVDDQTMRYGYLGRKVEATSATKIT